MTLKYNICFLIVLFQTEINLDFPCLFVAIVSRRIEIKLLLTFRVMLTITELESKFIMESWNTHLESEIKSIG